MPEHKAAQSEAAHTTRRPARQPPGCAGQARRPDAAARLRRPNPATASTAKPAGCQQAKPGDGQPTKPADGQPTKPTDGQPAKPGDGQTTTPAPGADGRTPPPTDATNKPQPTPETDAQHKASINTTVEALQKALGDDNPAPIQTYSEMGPVDAGPQTDKRQIMQVLGDKTPAEVKEISEAFNKAHGKDHGDRSLEDVITSRLDGVDKLKATDLFHRTDKADDPGRVHTAIAQIHEGGQSRDNCEKNIRDTLATMNKGQIDNFKAEYQSRYGHSFDQDIAGDDKMSPETKAAVGIYGKGAENRNAQDTQQLANLATKAKNLDMFQEAFRDATPEARTQYMANGGEDKMKAAFGGWFSNSDLDKAREYVQSGKLETTTKITDAKGLFGSNKEEIDAAIKGMSQTERDQYARGKTAAGTFQEYNTEVAGESVVTTFNTDGYNKLNPDQKKDYDAYRAVHEGLTNAGGADKVARWEDMIKNHDETLVTKVAEHGGLLGADKVDKVMSDIEGMNKADFDHLKQDASYRKQVEDALAVNYSGDDLKRAQASLSNKLGADSFEHSQGKQRSVEEQMADKQGFWSNDSKGILDAVKNMTPDEQKRYHDDAKFKADIDKQVQTGLGYGPEGDVARRMLDRVAGGQPLKEDVLDKMTLHEYGDGKTPEMLADIEKSFKDDPGLRARLANPQTDADKKYAAQFEEMGRNNFGGDYDKLVAPLVKDGHVPFAERAKLYDGWFSNDTKGLYAAIGSASDADKKAIADNPKAMLSFLTPEQQALASQIAKQGGELKPEDQMRAAVLGESGDKDAIKSLSASLKPEERAQLVLNYESKYGSNLTSDLDNKLSGQDRLDAERNFREQPDSARAAFNNARDEDLQSNDGVGRAFVKHWDGTADMSRDQVNQYAAAMSTYAKAYQEMPVEQSRKMSGDLTDAVDLYRKSKSAAADAAVDAAVIAGGVAVGVATGGVGLGVIGFVAVAGGAGKVAIKSGIEGDDYDTSKVGVDLVTGGVDAASMLVGPGEIAKAMEIGGKAGLAASRAVISEATKAAEIGGKQLLREGAEATLGNELKGSVTTALAHGAKEVDQKSLQKIAEKYAASPEDVPAVKALFTQELNKAVVSESQNAMRNTMREVALNSGAGAAGGGLSGGIRAGADWDNSKSFSENMANVGESTFMGAAGGAIMGGGMTAALKGAGKGFAAAREAMGAHMEVGSVDHAFIRPEGATYNRDGRIASMEGAGGFDVQYHKGGALDGTPSTIKMKDGTTFSSDAEGKWRVGDANSPQGIALDKPVKVTASGEVQVSYPNGDIDTHFADGSKQLKEGRSGAILQYGKDGELLAAKGINGQTAAFGYHADGSFEGVKYQNGRSLISEDGGQSFLLKEANGDSVKIQGKPVTGADGNLTFTDANNTSRMLKPDGSMIEYDRVTPANVKSITYPDGKTADFSYDAKGRISEYKTPDGGVYKLNEANSQHGDTSYDLETAHTHNEDAASNVWVTRDGKITAETIKGQMIRPTDGRSQIFDHNLNRVARETLPEGFDQANALRRPDGRLLDNAAASDRLISKGFPISSGERRVTSEGLVLSELKDVKAIGPDGAATSAYDSLMRDPKMSDAQKDSIIKNLSAVREHYASYRVGDNMSSNSEVNWIHTQGEMAKVLQAGRAKGLSAEAMHDSVIASMYSDSVKFSGDPIRNFTTHHLDGALAASRELERQGLPPERIEAITAAIRAHQIGPPKLMGELYHMGITSAINNDLSLPLAQKAKMLETLSAMSEVGPDGKKAISFMAHIDKAPKEMGADGQMQVKLTAEQQKVLGYAGIDKWNVPYDPKFDPHFSQMSAVEQAAALNRRDIAQTLIDGDSIDNYATTGGASKIVAIRGPETFFRDKTIFDSFKSVDESYRDAFKIMSPEAKKIAAKDLADRQGLANYDKSEIKTEMEDWLKSQGRDPKDKIPYYNTELKYPQLGPQLENGKILAGLTEQETADFQFAKQIRAKMVDLLRADHRTEGDMPGSFTAAKDIDVSAQARAKFAHQDAQPLNLNGKNPRDIEPNQIYTSADGNLRAMRSTVDDQLRVDDVAGHNTRLFDKDNKITSLSNDRVDRQFTYGADGKLSAVETTDKLTGTHTRINSGSDKNADNWFIHTTTKDGKVETEAYLRSKPVVDADGTVKIYDEDSKSYQRFNPDNSLDKVNATGRVDYLQANIQVEREQLQQSISRAFEGDPQRMARVDNITREFEDKSAWGNRNLSDNDRALLFKQVNRLLADNPGAPVSAAERADLAEQLLNHSAHPWTIDQGSNSTCNVETISHRLFWRNPDKAAQVVADAATTGKYRFADGREIDLRDSTGLIRPDSEAKASFAEQRKVNGALKIDGQRDYAGQILDVAMVNQRWATTEEKMTADGRILGHGDLRARFDKNGKSIGTTEEKHVTLLADPSHGMLTYDPNIEYKSIDGKSLGKIPPERVLYDKSGNITGVVDDVKNLQLTYNAQGKVSDVTALNYPGGRLYDKDGKLLYFKSRPGDLHYEKAVNNPLGEGEMVWTEVNGQRVRVQNKRGELIDSPVVYGSQLRTISDSISGLSEKPFVIGRDYRAGSGEINVTSIDDMRNVLEKLKADKEMPAVLFVNASKPPFGNPVTYDSEGKFNGWHVVNVHDIYKGVDPKTGQTVDMVRFTNQWGKDNDHLGVGKPLSEMYEALGGTPDKPPSVIPAVVNTIKKVFK